MTWSLQNNESGFDQAYRSNNLSEVQRRVKDEQKHFFFSTENRYLV